MEANKKKLYSNDQMNGHTHSHKQLTLTLTLRHFGHETRTNCRQRHQHMIAEGRHIMQPKKKKKSTKMWYEIARIYGGWHGVGGEIKMRMASRYHEPTKPNQFLRKWAL